MALLGSPLLILTTTLPTVLFSPKTNASDITSELCCSLHSATAPISTAFNFGTAPEKLIIPDIEAVPVVLVSTIFGLVDVVVVEGLFGGAGWSPPQPIM